MAKYVKFNFCYDDDVIDDVKFLLWTISFMSMLKGGEFDGHGKWPEVNIFLINTRTIIIFAGGVFKHYIKI